MPQFQSFNFRDRFIRHRNFEGILSRKQDEGPEADRYLRHRDLKLFLEPKNSPNLAADATTFFRTQVIDHGTELNPVDE